MTSLDSYPVVPSRYSNPFSTCWTTKLEYVESDQSVSEVLQEWKANNCWGTIVGPHGTGKTALLSALRTQLELEGWKCHWIEVRDSHLEAFIQKVSRHRGSKVVVMLEGFERLPFSKQLWFLNRLRRQQCHVLATLHRNFAIWSWRFKTLANTEVSIDLVKTLFERLICNADRDLVPWADALECWHGCDGNLREFWFELHELYESRRRLSVPLPEQRTTRVRTVAG